MFWLLLTLAATVTKIYKYVYIPNASIMAATLSTQWGDRCSGGGSASDQESGGNGRQLATSALK